MTLLKLSKYMLCTICQNTLPQGYTESVCPGCVDIADFAADLTSDYVPKKVAKPKQEQQIISNQLCHCGGQYVSNICSKCGQPNPLLMRKPSKRKKRRGKK